MELTLADVVEGLTGWRPAAMDQPIADAHMDSREVVEGGLFFALQGEQLDGHTFIPEALTRGCRVVVTEQAPESGCAVVDTRNAEALCPWSSGPRTLYCPSRTCAEGPWAKGPGAFREQTSHLLPFVPGPKDQGSLQSVQETPVCLLVPDSLGALQQLADYWRTRHTVRVIGVTGSVGKTTTKEMIATVLSQRYRVLKSERSINTATGLPLALLHLTKAHEQAVLEIGGGYELGEIARLARIARPHVGVVTNVGPTHLERMGTIERIALNKAELVEALPEDGVAILNADAPLVRDMAFKAQGRVFFYGLTPDADLWANEIESQGLEGLRFRFHHGEEVVHAKVPLLGRHSVHTALRAAAVGLIEGLSWQEIMDGLRGATQLRLLVVPGLNGSTLLDDTYNSSPVSAIAALNLLDELEGHKIAVLGDMLELGSYEDKGHRKVGRRAMDVVDLLVTVGPRGRIIAEETLALGMDPEAVKIVDNNDEAIAHLRQVIAPGDTVLVKGSRGMTMEQIVNALSVQ